MFNQFVPWQGKTMWQALAECRAQSRPMCSLFDSQDRRVRSTDPVPYNVSVHVDHNDSGGVKPEVMAACAALLDMTPPPAPVTLGHVLLPPDAVEVLERAAELRSGIEAAALSSLSDDARADLGSASVSHKPDHKLRLARQVFVHATERGMEDEIIAEALSILRERNRPGVAYDSPSQVRDLVTVAYSDKDHEIFSVTFLDSRHRLIQHMDLFTGTLTQTAVHPREVVKAALRLHAGSVILVHNHPSGDPEPSRADETLTKTLKDALALVDVRVLDHFIVAGGRAVSFAERGLI